MANEKTLDFNQAEEKSAVANGPAQNNTSVSDDDTEDIDQEIDATINKGGEDVKINVDDDDEDDTVVLPKKDLKKILDARDNYKTGLLSVKEKLKAKKSILKSQIQSTIQEPTAPAAGSPSTAIDSELKGILKGIQDDAIAKFCEDPQKEENWSKILTYYNPKRGKTSVRGIVSDLEDAWALFLKDNPDVKPKNTHDEDETGIAYLSNSNGISGSGKGKGQLTERKSVLPKHTPVQKWFG